MIVGLGRWRIIVVVVGVKVSNFVGVATAFGPSKHFAFGRKYPLVCGFGDFEVT